MKTTKIMAVLAMSLAVITLNSCKKKDAQPAYSITATVDGKVTSFNTNAKAVTASLQGITLTTIMGQASDGTTISILLNAAPTVGKTYTSGSTDTNSQPVLQLSTSSDSFLNDDSSSNLVTVTVNSVSSTSIQGTFKGDLASTSIGSSQPVTKSITNGTFNVSYSK